uniref:Growth hormone receptor b n=1 Tax=Xiphophorus couchianus TaxID=32473 RepID=A0A3B5LGF4_9TELE
LYLSKSVLNIVWLCLCSSVMKNIRGLFVSQLLFLIKCVNNIFYSSPVRPHFTDCVSRNMETFVCRWSAGSFQNLSEPKDLRLFYFNRVLFKNMTTCFRFRNMTSGWTKMCLNVLPGLILCFCSAVQPDPPFGLNWTLMNISLTGSHFDAMLSWRPPATADVETGWIALQYDAQYRQAGAERWEQVGLRFQPDLQFLGVVTEVRVRCKMLAGKDYGDFSDSVFIHIPSRVSRFPVMALLIFGTLFLVAVLLLVIISQQEKLMFILLPPVPGPKIRGIDPNLLKVTGRTLLGLLGDGQCLQILTLHSGSF